MAGSHEHPSPILRLPVGTDLLEGNGIWFRFYAFIVFKQEHKKRKIETTQGSSRGSFCRQPDAFTGRQHRGPVLFIF